MENGDTLIIKAARIANELHKGQFRKSGHVAYIIHPIRVAGAVAAHPLSTVEMVSAAFLHDTIEDTSYSKDQMLCDFGSDITNLAVELTNVEKNMELSREERKKIDRNRIKIISRKAKIIKMFDRIDNLYDLKDHSIKFIRIYLKESKLLLEEALTGTDEICELLYR